MPDFRKEDSLYLGSTASEKSGLQSIRGRDSESRPYTINDYRWDWKNLAQFGSPKNRTYWWNSVVKKPWTTGDSLLRNYECETWVNSRESQPGELFTNPLLMNQHFFN